MRSLRCRDYIPVWRTSQITKAVELKREKERNRSSIFKSMSCAFACRNCTFTKSPILCGCVQILRHFIYQNSFPWNSICGLKKKQTINEISSRPNDSDFSYTHQWPPYQKKKKLFNKSKCSPVYSSLYIQHAIAIWTKSHSRSTFFFGSPLKAARGFSLTRVYTFFYRGPLLLCCTRTRKRGKYSLFSFFFLLASV